MSIIRVGGRKLDIPPVRLKGDRKRSGPPLADLTNKARVAIGQGPVSDSPRSSPLSTRTVSTPDNNCLTPGPETLAFVKGLAKEDLAFRETALAVKQKGYQEAIGFYQQIGYQHPKYQEAAFRRVFCTYKLAMMEADTPKKLQLVQEVLTLCESADEASSGALFLKAACKQIVGEGADDQKLLEDAAQLFAQVDALDSNPLHLALRHGEWKYTLSFSMPDPQIKRGLLQEAIELFSKIPADHPTYQEVSFRLGDCKLHQAFCAESVVEHQDLLREALSFYARVSLHASKFTDVALKQAECKYYESLAESDDHKKQQLLIEAINFFEVVIQYPKYPKYVESSLNKGSCKQECANLSDKPEVKLKLYEEALNSYSIVPADHSFFHDVSFKQGECKYQQASMSTSSRIKRNLLE